MKNSIIPYEMLISAEIGHISSEDYMLSYQLKQEMMERGMFAFVSWRWVIPFAKWIGTRKVLEVMSGAGWLAKALREQGINLVATDTRKWERNLPMYGGNKWNIVSPIEKLSANNAIKKYGKEIDIMIISWPYMDSSAYHAIRTLYAINPKALVVYIGEGERGCTADRQFHDHFCISCNEIDEGFLKAANLYQSWPGIYDRMWPGIYAPINTESQETT